jgi:TPR repeat protein
MCKKGIGIEKDVDEEIYWYEQSAKQGYQYAKDRLIYLKLEIENIYKLSHLHKNVTFQII